MLNQRNRTRRPGFVVVSTAAGLKARENLMYALPRVLEHLRA